MGVIYACEQCGVLARVAADQATGGIGGGESRGIGGSRQRVANAERPVKRNDECGDRNHGGNETDHQECSRTTLLSQ